MNVKNEKSRKVDIAIDETDHMVLWCSGCNTNMKETTINAKNHREGVNSVSIWAKCPKCGLRGYRKIYSEYLREDMVWTSKTNINKDSDIFN